MIIREIQDYRVLDSTTNTPTQRPTNYRLILAPLLYWRIELTERRITVLEPQSGSLGAPDPNAFMVVVPPSYTAGQIFGIELLDTDWESEGFAVGDVLDMGMGSLITNSVFLRATIQGISGRAAMFIINTIYVVAGTLDTQNPFPLVAFLVNERFNTKAAFLRDGDVGFISPLNGQPFYTTGHANSLNIIQPTITNSTLIYNLRLYNAAQEANIDALMPNARVFKNVYVEVNGTQFYAYRSSLNPTANIPTQAYPTRGKIVIDAEAPNELRSLSFEAGCLLLHPNRIEETNSFVTPGTLTIGAFGSSINAPSIPSPVKQFVCLLGPDSHHSLPSVLSSIDLTAPIDVPNFPYAVRAGADYVGVVVGQVSGQWVAVMTNRIATTRPVYALKIVEENFFPARYDYIVLQSETPSTRLSGIYTVIIYAKINNSFVPVASYDLSVFSPVPTPLPDFFVDGTEILGNLFPFERKMPKGYGLRVANFDVVFFHNDPIMGNKTLFYVPLPSSQEPPNLGVLSSPPSGYLGDLMPFMDIPYTIKARVICPDGTFLESAPYEVTFTPRPDRQLASITRTPNNITITLFSSIVNDLETEFQIRVALFNAPADHSPIEQAMYYIQEDPVTSTIILEYGQNSPNINILRTPFTGYSYDVTINTSDLPPGKYVVHVRNEYVLNRDNTGDYESFYYNFEIRSPESPVGAPIVPSRCKTEIPAIYNEQWDYIVIDENDIFYRSRNITGCSLDSYCGCFTFVPSIPEDWIDIIGYFKGSIKGRRVPNNSIHKTRFRGRIIRLDDEYITEDFVSSLYRKEDIVRAYTTRYQVEIFAYTPCDLINLDILKLAERWDIINRSNRMLPATIYNLKPAEISISDSGEHAKITITLKTLRWRDEYRRQG
jgi:hypothetical protein